MAEANEKTTQPAAKPWDTIFRREGHVFIHPHESLPGFVAALPAPPARILDLGCGTGRHLVPLAEQGFHMYGFDRSDHGLRLSRDWLAEKGFTANLCVQDFLDPLPCANASFDALLSTQVIHHAILADIQKTISEVRRVLKPGGLTFISMPVYPPKRPNQKEIEPGTYVPQDGSECGLPHHYFTEEGLRQVFHAFDIHKIFTNSTHHLCIFAKKPESDPAIL